MATAIAAAGLLVSAGAATAQIRESERAGRRARRAGRRQVRRTAALEQEFRTREARETGTAAQRRARARQRQLAAGALGRRSTILTSPGGTVGESAQRPKQLLGL